MREIDTFVLGGLPVTIEFNVCSAEPDVGIMSAWVDEWYVTAIAGRAVKRADWVERRINADKNELEKMFETLHEAANEADDYDYD